MAWPCRPTYMCTAILDVEQTPFLSVLQVSQIFQKRKSHANKQDFEMKLNLTWKIKFNQPLKQ